MGISGHIKPASFTSSAAVSVSEVKKKRGLCGGRRISSGSEPKSTNIPEADIMLFFNSSNNHSCEFIWTLFRFMQFVK
jgi:hypothetical protein